MTIAQHIAYWEEIAERHRDAMRATLETREASESETLARAADGIAAAVRAYDAAL